MGQPTEATLEVYLNSERSPFPILDLLYVLSTENGVVQETYTSHVAS